MSQEEFLGLGRVNAKNSAERLWFDSAGDSHVSFNKRRESRNTAKCRARCGKNFGPQERLTRVPITHITNGVHAPTWVSPLLRYLYEKYVGYDWTINFGIANGGPKQLREFRTRSCGSHILCSRSVLLLSASPSIQSRMAAGEKADYIEAANSMFDPKALTIGFARRVAGYKRWNLLLTDPERSCVSSTTSERPVQFVFAGKAHPQDEGSKLILQQLAQWKYDAGSDSVRSFSKTTIRRLRGSSYNRLTFG